MITRFLSKVIRRTPKRFFSNDDTYEVDFEEAQEEVDDLIDEMAPSVIDKHYFGKEVQENFRYKIDFDHINLEHYRDLNEKVKRSSGYAMIQVEPFPRMKIMKIGLILLDRLRDLPEGFIFRIYMGQC